MSMRGKVHASRTVRRSQLHAMKCLIVLLAAVITVAASAVEYRKFYVESEIVSRYSTTRVTSVVRNGDDVSQELSFQVQLPETAFVSRFTMIANGQTYSSVARERETAAAEYQDKQEQGENVGLVESRGTNLFAVRISAAANSTATFELTYEELIVRCKSKFQQVFSLNPGSVVEDIQVTVHVIDQQGIAYKNAPEYVSIEVVSSKEVTFSYSPSPGDQGDTEYGLARDMVVEYDVHHPANGVGLFVVNDYYFAQFFSPSDLEPVPLELVFVIDVSGSMSGRKIEQTRQALETIIYQLRPQDWFSIVTFECSVSSWRDYLVPAAYYKANAAEYARGLTTEGMTDLNAAIIRGASILATYGRREYIQLLVVLTDGLPTIGVVNPDDIINNAEDALAGTSISLNCLGFGDNVNFHLLEQLALTNRGTFRRIYEGNDSATQLEGFFEEISSPILSEINVTYQDGSTEITSNTQFPLLFNGSEIIIAGKLHSDFNTSDIVLVKIVGNGATHEITFQSQLNTTGTTAIAGREPSTERLVAYLFIKQLIDKLKATSNEFEIAEIKQEIIELALKYNFVTDYTSLLVVDGQSSEREQVNEEKPTEQSAGPFIVQCPGDPPQNPLPGGPKPTGPQLMFDDPNANPSTSTCAGLRIEFFNNSPKVIGNDRIDAWFRVVGSASDHKVTCYLIGHHYNNRFVSSTCEGYVSYTNLQRDKYTFRVVANSGQGRRETRNFTLSVGYGPHFCYVHWINQGVMVWANSGVAEFAAVGNFTSLQCKMDKNAYHSCTSPQQLSGLSAGNHTFRVKPQGCTVNDRITHKFQI